MAGVPYRFACAALLLAGSALRAQEPAAGAGAADPDVLAAPAGAANAGDGGARTGAGAGAGAGGEPFPHRIEGDIGLGGSYLHSIVSGQVVPVRPLPYGFFDYERAFVRIDTVGVKTLPLAYGHLELLARASQDGIRSDTPSLRGIAARSVSIPVGIGSLQVTPVGGFFLNAFHDVNRSRGNLGEAIWAAQFEAARVTVYPQLGVHTYSASYVQYFYGLNRVEAARSGYASYRPGSAVDPLAGAFIDTSIGGRWHVDVSLRHERLGRAIADSPIVARHGLDTALLVLAYHLP